MNEESFLREAVGLARVHSADGRNGPFGALVTRGSRVIGKGWNRVVETKDPTAHAEILAIREAARTVGSHELRECVLYSSCEPCPMCLAAIYWARIPRIVFAASATDAAEAGFDDSTIAREIALPPGSRRIEEVQRLREEGQAVLRAWKRNPDRISY